MRLLFDENISYRIKKKLEEHFPGSKHISDISKSRITDLEIWKYAKVNDLIIVSKDEDFYEWQLVKTRSSQNHLDKNWECKYEYHFDEIDIEQKCDSRNDRQ